VFAAKLNDSRGIGKSARAILRRARRRGFAARRYEVWSVTKH
jgi:hypothetical protein